MEANEANKAAAFQAISEWIAVQKDKLLGRLLAQDLTAERFTIDGTTYLRDIDMSELRMADLFDGGERGSYLRYVHVSGHFGVWDGPDLAESNKRDEDVGKMREFARRVAAEAEEGQYHTTFAKTAMKLLEKTKMHPQTIDLVFGLEKNGIVVKDIRLAYPMIGTTPQ